MSLGIRQYMIPAWRLHKVLIKRITVLFSFWRGNLGRQWGNTTNVIEYKNSNLATVDGKSSESSMGCMAKIQIHILGKREVPGVTASGKVKSRVGAPSPMGMCMVVRSPQKGLTQGIVDTICVDTRQNRW